MSEALERFAVAVGVRDPRVLEAVARLSRERFVPASLRALADVDAPIPIGHGATISQPSLVAYTLERLSLTGGERVLEIGTGSGYQTALLARLSRQVLSVELEAALSSRAQAALDELGVANVRLRVGDGAEGWPEAAPFDRIVVSAAVDRVPPALLDQLATGGRMIVPVGPLRPGQVLRQIDRGADDALLEHDLLPVAFVPLRGPWRQGQDGG